jgi:hypothetical protein
VAISTDCTGICKFNYHTITITVIARWKTAIQVFLLSFIFDCVLKFGWIFFYVHLHPNPFLLNKNGRSQKTQTPLKKKDMCLNKCHVHNTHPTIGNSQLTPL